MEICITIIIIMIIIHFITSCIIMSTAIDYYNISYDIVVYLYYYTGIYDIMYYMILFCVTLS